MSNRFDDEDQIRKMVDDYAFRWATTREGAWVAIFNSGPLAELPETLEDAYDQGWDDALREASIDEGWKRNPFARKK